MKHDTCAIQGCVEVARPQLCREHFEALPDDVQDRLRWALAEGDDMDVAAALRAAEEELGCY